MRGQIHRLTSATVADDRLNVKFADGVTGSVALRQIKPRSGKPDWSALTIQMKGAHIAVPVCGAEDEQHEIPWDVLRGFCDPGFEGFRVSSDRPEQTTSKPT